MQYKYNADPYLEGRIKSALALCTLKLEETPPAYVYRWCIHPYILQPVLAFRFPRFESQTVAFCDST
ncbi:hypothetical protein T07_10397 [Trichinella nelsoni]|uniref:Uncharacterized protein n=1 Tax=Trichinella nelsoni TaxID=6336 RepID=A0A0V0RJJ4_9BILA|nr:hypothetical protein T07_10397 [Trichinella nelsoni]